MPVEINELHVKAKIADQEANSTQDSKASTENRSSYSSKKLDKAVKHLSDMIKRKNER